MREESVATALIEAEGARGAYDDGAANRRAQGHDMDLKPVGPTGGGARNPALALRSTANDLLKLLDLFLSGAGPGELPEAARLMLTLDRPGDDGNTRMTLGWRRTIVHGETYYWSHGSGDGSRTFMGFNPTRGVAVVALADAASGAGLDDIARRVLDPMQPVDMKVVPRPRAVELPPAAIERVLGTYRYAPGDEMTITRGATALIVTAGSAQFLIQRSRGRDSSRRQPRTCTSTCQGRHRSRRIESCCIRAGRASRITACRRREQITIERREAGGLGCRTRGEDVRTDRELRPTPASGATCRGPRTGESVRGPSDPCARENGVRRSG